MFPFTRLPAFLRGLAIDSVRIIVLAGVLFLVDAVSPGRAARNPKTDAGKTTEAWLSEDLARVATEQLHGLGAVLQARSGSDDLSDMMTGDFTLTPLVPAALEKVFDDGGIQVFRGRETQEESPGLDEALQSLYQRFPAGVELRAAFKIDRIRHDERTGEVDSRAHVSLAGGGVTQEALWQIRWQLDPDASGDLLLPASLRLREIRLQDFEESILTDPEAAALFNDCTESVFRQAPSFGSQLRPGNEFWRERIENAHHFDKFGHQGIALGDVDGDGWDDVYICQPGGLPNRLYRHLPDGTVEDISAESGTDWLDNTRSALCIDFDNNGSQDLILAAAPGLVFLRNDGKGIFQPANVISQVQDAYSLAASDYDNDGDLDLYACRYYPADADTRELPVPVPYDNAKNGGENFLIRNEGNWRTANATEEAGLEVENRRFSYAAVWVDVDGDGDEDLYVANDFGRNNLYENEGGRFREISERMGVAVGAFGMSATAGDYNRDGREDLYVGNMFSSAGSRVTRQEAFKPELSEDRRQQFQHLARGNTLFANGGAEGFRDVSEEAGVAWGRWSWGSLFVDVNLDGWEDLLVANGYLTGRDPDDL